MKLPRLRVLVLLPPLKKVPLAGLSGGSFGGAALLPFPAHAKQHSGKEEAGERSPHKAKGVCANIGSLSIASEMVTSLYESTAAGD